MKLLLDTHVWYWALETPERLGKQTHLALESGETELAISPISTIELGQLALAKRLVFKGNIESWVRRGMASLLLETLELTHPIAALAYSLPGTFHKDPADRILVATAIHHGVSVATADERILNYAHVKTLDARR